MRDDKPLPSSFDNTEFFNEKPINKLVRRIKEEPLVPLGIVATCYALYRAYRSMKMGDSAQLNKMFRARIYAQAFTLVACVGGGMYYGAEREQRKVLERAMDERKSQEKRDAWLRELELRDKEDQDWRERHAEMEKKAKESELIGLDQNQVQEVQKKDADADVVRSPVEMEKEEKKEKDAEGEKGGVLDAVKDLVKGGK